VNWTTKIQALTPGQYKAAQHREVALLQYDFRHGMAGGPCISHAGARTRRVFEQSTSANIGWLVSPDARLFTNFARTGTTLTRPTCVRNPFQRQDRTANIMGYSMDLSSWLRGGTKAASRNIAAIESDTGTVACHWSIRL
jgi:hypothetical protein